MRYLEKYLDGMQTFLEVTVYDEEDEREIKNHRHEPNVVVDLCDLPYLSRFDHIERLILRSGEIPPDAPKILGRLTDLLALGLDYVETEDGTPYCIDVSCFPKLEFLFSRSSRNFRAGERTPAVKTLRVGCWYDRDLSRLKGFAPDSLSVGNGRLTALTGIENLPLLALSLSYQPRLTDISPLGGLPLRILELVKCGRADPSGLSLPFLEYLILEGSLRVENLDFLQAYPALRRVILDIDISDGDLSPLDRLEKAVIQIDKRRFNRKDADLPKSEVPYEVSQIPDWRWIFNDRWL